MLCNILFLVLSLAAAEITAVSFLQDAHRRYIIAKRPGFNEHNLPEHLQPEPVATIAGDKVRLFRHSYRASFPSKEGDRSKD